MDTDVLRVKLFKIFEYISEFTEYVQIMVLVSANDF